jgi:hypothetical protein
MALVLLAGCAVQDDEARATAEEFVDALARGDGARACALLAPEARSGLEESSGQSCRAAVLAEKVPDEPVEEVDVFESMAEARFATHAVFLAQLDSGWRVRAAACTPVPDSPYDCSIEGG